MFDFSQAKEARIKRANTDWWINEKAIVADNGMTYIVYMTDMGEIHIKELDAKCSRTPSRDFRLCKLNCFYADEHNSPSLCILEDGTLVVAYTGHAATNFLKYRVSARPYDISSFGPEITIPYEGSVTYAQLFENTARNELWLFTRVNGVTWEFRSSSDRAKTWSKPHTFLRSNAGGLFYFDVRKLLVPSQTGVEERWFFALYGHPLVSKDHTIRSGLFDSNGQLLQCDGTATDFNLFSSDRPMELEELEPVYESPEGTTVRLLDVSPTMPLRVGFAPFVIDCREAPDPSKAYYCAATFVDGKWVVAEPICTAGEFLAKNIIDGSQTYLGGMAYYYGVGDAGLHPRDWAETHTNRLFIARFDGKDRVLESYCSVDHGRAYRFEQEWRRIPGGQGIKIWRPIVPIYAQDNLPVYWHEGTYGAHTGGWHCDAVMYLFPDD